MGVSNYTPTGISHATSVDFSKRSVSQPVHIVQYDRSLPILAVSLYNNGQLYRLSEDMEVSIRLGKPDRTFVYNKALGCDSTRTIVYFEITQQMSLFDGEYYPVIEIMDGDKIANSSTIYLVVDRNPVQHNYIESTIEYKELVDYRDEAVEASKEAKESAKIASDSAKTAVDKTKASEEAAKLSETNAKDSENKAKKSENESVKYSNLAKSYAVGTDNAIRENDAEDNAKTYCEAANTSAVNAKQSETNAKTYLDKIIEKVDVTVDAEMSDTSENPVQNKVIKKYVDEHNPEVADMTGATATQNGTHGLVPAPQMGDEKKALLGDGTWGSVDAILTFKTKEEYDAAVANDEIPDGAKVIKEYDDGDSTAIIDVDIEMSDTSVNPVQNKVIKKYVDEHTPEVADMTGATAEANGTSGTVPAPKAGQEAHILNGDGTWTSPLDNAIIAAKIEELNQAIEDAKALKASLETYGMVQLNDTSVVTDSTGLALPATEKNPNLEGTLANQISQLNTDLLGTGRILEYPSNLYIDDESFDWTESKIKKIENFINANKANDIGLLKVNNGFTYGGLFAMFSLEYYSFIVFTYALDYFTIVRKYKNDITIKRVYFVEQ